MSVSVVYGDHPLRAGKLAVLPALLDGEIPFLVLELVGDDGDQHRLAMNALEGVQFAEVLDRALTTVTKATLAAMSEGMTADAEAHANGERG